MAPENKNCQNCKASFTIEPDEFAFYQKIDVPPPTWCPECRNMRRMACREDHTLYRGTCKLCGKSIITIHSPDGPFTVYCRECYVSDEWDPMRVIKGELDRLRQFSFPLPRQCPQCRFTERRTLRLPFTLWRQQCQCAGAKSQNGTYQNNGTHQHEGACPNVFETSYAPDRPEIVYCEQCYNAEVA